MPKQQSLNVGEKLSNIVLLHHFWGIDLFCSEMTGHKNVVPGGNGTLHVHHIKKRTSSKKKSYAIKRINFEKPFLQDAVCNENNFQALFD